MYSWDIVNLYCHNHPRWFEGMDRYVAQDAHLAVFRELMPPAVRLRRRGLWYIADVPGAPAMPEQGWKLHVSASAERSAIVLRKALPVLRDERTDFKFLLDPQAVSLTNGKLWPRTSSGKFITVYPADKERFLRLAASLTAALDGESGPYVLSDRRCPGSTAVYYRYGGFTGVSRTGLDGGTELMITALDGALHPDTRPPYFQLPPWVSDPFAGHHSEDDGDGTGLLDRRFEVTAALAFSNRGGVYKARDTRTGADVVIKEARPYVQIGHTGALATDVMAKEHRLLHRLVGTGYTVRPVAFFQQWEHTFLVEEWLTGSHLGEFTIANNPMYGQVVGPASLRAYYGRMKGIWLQAANAVAAAHERGVVIGDLSLTNLMVLDDDSIRLVDLEGAIEEGVDHPIDIYTPGVASPRTVESGRADRANDYYALGALMLNSIMLVVNHVGFHPPAGTRFLAELSEDLALPADLVSLIADLTDPAMTSPPNPAQVAARIRALPFADHPAWERPVPIAQPAAEVLSAAGTAALTRQVGQVLAGVADYLERTADVTRTDRLFPADLAVFETNPLSISFGAAGVLHVLHAIRGAVPAELTAWLLQHTVDNDDYPPGLYMGQAGIAWVLAELGQPDAAVALLRQARHHELLWAAPDVLLGCAGYAMACLRLATATGFDDLLTDAVRVGEHLARAAVREERGAYWVNKDGKIPIGYGRGGSGIALFLLSLTGATGDPAHAELGRAALDFDLAHGRPFNEHLIAFPRFSEPEAQSENLLKDYWDEGTAGVLATLLRYHAVTGDPELRRWIDLLLRDTCRKYAAFPQLFHGLAGLGNVVLDAYEFLGEPNLLAEARRVAQGVLLFAIDRPEGIAFPGEQAVRETADFATGSAGVALFLQRLLRAEPGGRTNDAFMLDELLPVRTGVLG